MISEWLVDHEPFRHPFTCMIVGPTQSGKTFFIKEVLHNTNDLIITPPEKIYYCYSAWKPMFDEFKSKLTNINFC